MRVLIADDSEDIRNGLIKALNGIDGIEIVGEVEDSADAVEAVERLKPDVVILDIRMPQGDGILTLQTIKRGKLSPKTVMYTSFPYPHYRQQCMEAGADFFFDKSTEFKELTDLLKELATRRYENTPKNGLKIKIDARS